MESVFIVQHLHRVEECDETKLIGVYTSRKDAEEVVKRLQTMPGFREHPTGFSIDRYDLNVDYWTEGFTSD